jgi:hypothetical protein
MQLRNARSTILAAAVVLSLVAVAHSGELEPIIRVEGEQITLHNDVGCKLAIHHQDGRYGLGTFYVNNVPLGAPIECFLTEDDVGDNARDTLQQLWPGQWQPRFRPSKYQIVENSPERGVIKFWGQDGKFDGAVTITLGRSATGYRLDYDIAALKCITHPVYAAAPLWADKMQFVQFPFENPILPPFGGKWSIHPTRSTVPLMFGCEKIGDKPYYVGVGYCLSEPYQQGRLEYDAAGAGALKAYYISPHASGWLGRPRPEEKASRYRLSMVIATAASQYDCVAGYRLQSDYDISTPVRRSLDDSIAGVMAMYRDCKGYVALPPNKNRAYRQQINPQTGMPVEKGYGFHVPIGVNVQLAYQLYRYWQDHRSETWAQQRAISMADFFVETQDSSGAVPTLWDTQERRFRAYQPKIDKAGYIYATCQQAMGAQSLYRLYLARKRAEGIEVEAWKNSALRAIDDLVKKVEPNGLLGRNYDRQGKYDTACAADWPLLALDYFATETKQAKYEDARTRLEQWVYETFIRTNHWFGWSSDAGWWLSETPPPWNVDALNSFTLATYCTQRYLYTGQPKYLDWAKHIIAYNWLMAVPTQFSEFKHVTKGLVREQEFYVTYDLPFRTCLWIDGLAQLSALSGDRFFADYYKLMVQTQLAYQNLPPQMQSFNIGLWWDASGADPADNVGEVGVNYIVEFCSLFLESVTGPGAYRYVGGPDWGVGLDYELKFQPQFDPAGPYVAGSRHRLDDAHWDPDSKTLHAKISGPPDAAGQLLVGWRPTDRYRLAGIHASVDGKPAATNPLRPGTAIARPGEQGGVSISYTLKDSTASIEVVFP